MSAARVRAGGAYVELALTDDEFRKGLKRSEQAMKEWVRNNKKELAKMERAFRELNAKFAKLLTQSIPKGLVAITNGLGKVGVGAAKMGSIVNGAMRRAAKGIDKVLASVTNLVSYKNVNKAIQMISHSIMQLGASMRRSGFDMLFSGLAVSLGLGSTLKDLTELDKIFASIRGTVPMTASEFKNLKEQVRKVGETSQFTSKEVGEVALQLTKAGLALGKMDPGDLESLLRSFVGFGLSTGIEDLSQLTEIAVQATGAFGALGKDSKANVARIQRTMNIMVAASNRSAMSVTDMFEAWKMAAPMANQIGMRQEELASLVGSLADVGLKGTLAGTSLRRLFTNLAQEDKIAKLNAGLTRFGQTAINTKDMFGNLKNVSQIMNELGPKIAKLGTAARISLATEVFDVRGSNAALAIMDGIENVQRKTLQIASDRFALARKQREMQNSFYGLVKRTSSAFQELKLVIAEAMQPLAETGLRMLITVINMIKKDTKVLERVVRTIGLIAAGATVLGVAMITAGSAIMLVTSSLVAMASVAVPLVGAMVTMAAAGERMSKAWSEIRGVFSGGLGSGLSKAVELIAKGFDRVVDSIRRVVVGVNLGIAGLRTMVSLTTVFGQMVITNFVMNIVKMVSLLQLGASAIAMIFNPVIGLVGLFSTLKSLFTSMLEIAKQIGAAFSQGANTIMGIAGGVARMLGQMLKMEAIANAIKIAFGGIGKFLVSMVSNIQAIAPQLQQLAMVLKNAIEIGDMDTAGAALGSMFSQVGLAIGDAIRKATDYMTNKIQEVFGPLIQAFKQVKSFTGNLDIAKTIKGMGMDMVSAVDNAIMAKTKMGKAGSMGGMWDWMFNGGDNYKTAMKKAKEGLTPTEMALTKLNPRMLDSLSQIGFGFMDMADPIAMGIEKMMTGDFTDKIVGSIITVGNILTTGFAALLELLGGMASAMGYQGGLAMGASAGQGLRDMWKGTIGTITKFENQMRMQSKIQDWFNKAEQFFAQAQRDKDMKAAKKKADDLIKADKFNKGLQKLGETAKNVANKMTLSAQDVLLNKMGLPRPDELFNSLRGQGAELFKKGPMDFLKTKQSQLRAQSIDRNRMEGTKAAEAIGAILKNRLGSVNLSREAGAVGQSAAALAGTRYATVDQQQLGELKQHTEELKKANKRLKNMNQKPIKVVIK